MLGTKHHHVPPLSTPYSHQYYKSPSTSSTTSTSSHTQYPPHTNLANNTYSSFGHDVPLFDFQDLHMSSENHWYEHGQLTPKSTTRAHHRAPSLASSIGSAGPASPYPTNTSNPQVAGESYHDFHEYEIPSKPLTPAQTPLQETFLLPHYSNAYPINIYNMGHDGLPRNMAATNYNQSNGQHVVANESSATTPGEANNGYRDMPKFVRTVTDAHQDELYMPDYPHTTSMASSMPAPSVTVSQQNDVFAQRLQAANSQHLRASNSQVPVAVPQRDRSPFRDGSILAPASYQSARALREQQKLEHDSIALQHQLERVSPVGSTPNTISPKDVDLVYHETEEDANAPLFPPQQSQRATSSYRQTPVSANDSLQVDDNASTKSYGSMATTRRESSSAYSSTSQAPLVQGNYSFASPALPHRKLPQQYPFVPQTRRGQSNMSNATEDFPATLASMESSSSEYVTDNSEIQRPAATTADTGTYSCTYHGCTLRFDTPAKLQRHKREGHRNPASIGGDDGMTSAAQRNSQAGPHKCERINPSTNKPCDTVFSRPYDLTRHEDTIHNARKQKVHCPYCTEEKTFSRNDALTRHLRVVHPERAEPSRRRRGGSD